MLSQFLSNIVLPTEVLLCKGKSCVCHYGLLQRYYSDIVNSLETAGNQCIPSVKVGVRKHWWSPDLDELKQQCNDICNLWKDIGCPRNGLINAERLKCKYKYKQAIKEAAFNADRSLNDDLFNHLCTKDDVSFWKAWRKRFCANNVAPTTVLNGKCGVNAIVHEFTCYYSSIFKPNTADADEKFRDEVEYRLTNDFSSVPDTSVPLIDVSCLLDHMAKLKRGKTAGIDGIVNEHILFGGDCLAVHLSLLFNAMVRHSFVPTEFCHGIIVPLLKCKHGDASQLDMYRGITLSPVLSKLFESVLLDLFGLFLTSSDLQFGF